MNDEGVEENAIMKKCLILILNDESFIIHQVGKVDREQFGKTKLFWVRASICLKSSSV